MNLLPLLTKGERLRPRTLFWGFGRQRAVRDGDWKLVLEAPQQRTSPALFNLAHDVGETQDLAAAEPERVRRMMAALAAWEKEVAGKG